MSKTSASKLKSSKSLTFVWFFCDRNLKEVLTTWVPPFIGPPSACDIFAFVLHFRVTIFLTNPGFTTGPEAAVSKTASARIPPLKQTMTVSNEECLGLVPSVGGSLPNRFPNRRLSRSRCRSRRIRARYLLAHTILLVQQWLAPKI